MMKKFIFLCFLNISFSVYCQDQQKVGALVFESHKFMGNKHLKPSDAEIKREKEKLRAFVKKEIDSVTPDKFINSFPKPELEHYGGSMKCLHTFDIYEEYYESVVECDYIKKTNIQRYEQIKIKTLEANTIERDINTNHYKILGKRQLTLSPTPNDYEIIEYRDETKLILGYECFKVVLKKKFQENLHLTIYDVEMYVTEAIKLNYSPVTRYKEILKKYYPLEITRKPRNKVMAEVTTWKIKTIDLKKDNN